MTSEGTMDYNTDAITQDQFVTFYVGDLLFGIDVVQVQEIIRFHEMTPVPLSSSMVEGLINLRGQIITAIDLRKRFGMDERGDEIKPMNVVVRSKDGTVSLLVDRIGDVLEVEGSQYEKTPERMPGVSKELVLGVFKLPSGLLLVLDTERTVDVTSLT